MYLNSRALKQLTLKEKFPIIVIDDLLDEFRGAKFFTKVNLCSRYRKI